MTFQSSNKGVCGKACLREFCVGEDTPCTSKDLVRILGLVVIRTTMYNMNSMGILKAS